MARPVRRCLAGTISYSMVHPGLRNAQLSPHSVYNEAIDGRFPPSRPLEEEVYDHALQERPTVIYFHGNVRASVASSLRV